MKPSKHLLLLLILTQILTACSQNLPDNYGIYLYTDKGRVPLTGQKISFTGNLFQAITGVKGTSSNQGYATAQYLIVFEKDVNPKSIRLTKLDFKKGGYVQNIIGNTYVDVNLWTASKNIPIDIAPIDGKKDMYKISPKEKLTEGFYALHFGGLENMTTIEATNGNIAFDFVIGSAEPFQSAEVLKKRTEEQFKIVSENLLKTVNECFNNRDYVRMREFYRPDGRILSDQEWQEFTQGLVTWINEAGKITDSRIVTSIIMEEEGTYQIQTSYEKKGQQTETLIIKKIGEKFYIISLG